MPFPTTNATEELPAVNEILASVGQAPVTTLDQTNPDVAIAYNTLLQVSREVQAEGWTFNTEIAVPFTPDGTTEEVDVANNILQLDLTKDAAYYDKDPVIRTKTGSTQRKLYDKNKDPRSDAWKWGTDDIKCDVVYNFDWVVLPVPIQDYIVARAAAIVSSRIVGDSGQYQMLQQKEAYNRAMALEYECNQGDYTFFGHPKGQNNYNGFQPYHALYR